MTYITSRIIAMSFPAQGYLETTYRNPISEVFDITLIVNRLLDSYKISMDLTFGFLMLAEEAMIIQNLMDK